MFTIVAVFEAKEGAGAALNDALTKLIEPTLAEPGCLRYELFQSQDNPRAFIFYEHWMDEKAHQSHRETAHYQASQKVLPDLLNRPYEVIRYSQ